MLTISGTIRRTETPDGAILLDIEQGQLFSVNPVGSQILDLIGAGCNEAQIADRLSIAFGADIDTVRRDVHEFLESLSRQNIVFGIERATKDGDDGRT